MANGVLEILYAIEILIKIPSLTPVGIGLLTINTILMIVLSLYGPLDGYGFNCWLIHNCLPLSHSVRINLIAWLTIVVSKILPLSHCLNPYCKLIIKKEYSLVKLPLTLSLNSKTHQCWTSNLCYQSPHILPVSWLKMGLQQLGNTQWFNQGITPSNSNYSKEILKKLL